MVVIIFVALSSMYSKIIKTSFSAIGCLVVIVNNVINLIIFTIYKNNPALHFTLLDCLSQHEHLNI
jgi:hypothetical protein